MTFPLIGSGMRAVCFALLAALAACAPSAETASRMMLDLNRQALVEHEKGKHEAAKGRLERAVSVGKRSGLDNHPLMARTELHLGVVYAAGLKDRDKAVAHMATALAIQPEVRLSRSLASAPARRAFVAARAEAREKAREREREKAKVASAAKAAAAGEKGGEKAGAQASQTSKDPPAGKKVRGAAVARSGKGPGAEPAGSAKVAEPAARKTEEPGKKNVQVALAPPPSTPVDAEPAVPSALPQPVFCPTPDEAPQEAEIVLRCATRSGLRASRLLLHYRAPGSETYTPVTMSRSPRGWYAGVVPASATTGASLQFYVEAQTAGDKLAGSNGQSDSPNLLLLRRGAAPFTGEALAAVVRGDRDEEAEITSQEENPLEAFEKERAMQGQHRRGPGAIWVAFGVGSGYGWQPGRSLEFRDSLQVGAGFLGGGLLHATPEVGYQWSEQLAFSLQGRHQYIPEEGSGDDLAGRPHRSAHALLARAHYYVGAGNAQLFATGTLGVGQGFRLVVPAAPPAARNDTVRGGPVVLGPGGGFVYHFNAHIAWATEARLLVGVWNVAAVGELQTGVQVGF